MTVAARHGFLWTIARESRSVREYARRAEAWAATESRPPSDLTLVRVWQHTVARAPRRYLLQLIHEARTARLRSREDLIRRLMEEGK